MAVAQVDSGLLVSKIAAFCAGFGQPAELCAALRDSTVVVPLVGDDRVLKLPLGGLDLVCAFTGIAEWARNRERFDWTQPCLRGRALLPGTDSPRPTPHRVIYRGSSLPRSVTVIAPPPATGGMSFGFCPAAASPANSSYVSGSPSSVNGSSTDGS